MARYRASIETTWTPEAAFDYLSDFSTSAEWDPGVLEAERVGRGAATNASAATQSSTASDVAVGTEFRLVADFLGRSSELTYRVVEYERPSAVTFHAENATVVSHDRITFEPTTKGTRVTYDAELGLRGIMRLADPLLALAFKRVGDRALRGLGTVLAGPPRHAPS